ncbi:hypothetical protein [Salidesulfovibrio onnuriiensis]|uniref:hypothetical protein n=1 Tax=Salidesulfovibrio onnuriiensis TaxID=2583823 RepID=UPI0011C9839F|nr:hypothetical protein [Salidesulfovibrio onnuriiensis]
MKRISLSLIALACVLLMAAPAFAQSDFNAKGSALIPGMVARHKDGYMDYTNLILTNITGSPVTCKVTVYDHNGNDVTADNSRVVSGNFQTISTGTGTFELPANSTRVYQFWKKNSNTMIHGHAIVEWTSSDNTHRKALIGTVRHFREKGDKAFGTSLLINNGQPF